jgi:hypothetical protein
MQRLVVKPIDLLDGRELELAAGAPHTVGDQLGFTGAHERFRQGVVRHVSDSAIDASTSWSSSTRVQSKLVY